MEILSWNWALICLGVIAVLNMINGYKKGIVKEVINCVSLLVLTLFVVLLSSVIKSYTNKQYLEMIAVIIMVLILSIGHKLIKMALDGMQTLASLPIIKWIDKAAGILFGLVETVLVAWCALCLVGMFEMGVVGEYINMYICKSQLLSYLYENNLIAVIGETIRGQEFQMKAVDMILEQGKNLMENVL